MSRFRAFWRRTGAVAAKEVAHILRDPSTLYLAFGMPLVLIVLFGYGVSFDLDHAPLAVLDQDGTPASRELARSLTATHELDVVATPRDATDIERLFRRREASVALVVPSGYSQHLERGEPSPVQLLLDGSDGTMASAVLGAATQLVTASLPEPPVAARTTLLYNPSLRSAVFFVPGLIAYVMAIAAVLLTSLTIAREWERGNLELLFTTPVGRLEIVLGKLAPYLVLGLVQALLVLAVGTELFDVPIRGNLVLLFFAALLFLIGMLGQGLLISVVARSQQVATQVGAISSLLPTLILSGFLFPIENMPPPLQVLASIFPARYFIDALRGVLLKGAGLDVLWIDLVGMAAFAFVVLAVATLKFRRGVS
jgi:ABC-2 type transport system permease protein